MTAASGQARSVLLDHFLNVGARNAERWCESEEDADGNDDDERP